MHILSKWYQQTSDIRFNSWCQTQILNTLNTAELYSPWPQHWWIGKHFYTPWCFCLLLIQIFTKTGTWWLLIFEQQHTGCPLPSIRCDDQPQFHTEHGTNRAAYVPNSVATPLTAHQYHTICEQIISLINILKIVLHRCLLFSKLNIIWISEMKQHWWLQFVVINMYHFKYD